MNEKEREYFISQRISKHEVIKEPVTKEQYLNRYRPIWRQQKAMQKSGECRCPQKHLWECDGACFDCPYYHKPYLSLDNYVTDSPDEETTHLDLVPDTSDVEKETTTNAYLLDLLFKQLETIYPEGIEICHAIVETTSLRKAAEFLQMSWSSFQYKYGKVKEIAKKMKKVQKSSSKTPKKF